VTPALTAGFAATACLIEEPDATFGLVNPVLEQTRRRHVAVFIANIAGLAHTRDQLKIVVAQLGQHIKRRHEISIVVLENSPLPCSPLTSVHGQSGSIPIDDAVAAYNEVDWRTKSPTAEGCLACKQLFHGSAYEQFSSIISLPVGRS